jgi:uncharacterized heparinase superfamily protein
VKGAGLAGHFRRAVFASAPYAWTLGGHPGGALRATPTQPWSGDAQRGAQILKGTIALDGEAHAADGAVWHAGSDSWRAELHGFDWLADLHAVGSDAARRRARELVGDWMTRHARWNGFAWRPDILSQRITAWIAEHDFFCASADDAFRDAYLTSLSRQSRHLARVASELGPGLDRLNLAKALIYAAIALPGPKKRLSAALSLLETELRRQILPDGGHAARSGAVQLRALGTLVDVRGCLTAGREALPTALQSAIDRMAPALRAFRHGDGGLALFNGADEEESWRVDAVLAQAEAPGRAPEELRHTGFQRLRAGRTLIIMDTGAPPPAGLDRDAHAGTLGFEMGTGKERIVVNCGGRSGAARTAQRASAAHSTLVLENTNSAEIEADGGLGRKPSTVPCTREAADGAILVEASHDGYQAVFGARHARRLYLSADGTDVRGEDRVEAGRAMRAIARFHLHPSVSASLQSGGASVLLRTPSGEGWRFQAAGGEIRLAESAYWGRREETRRTEQIEVHAAFGDGGGAFKWTFKRVGPAD